MTDNIRVLYGLKHNPFLPNLPTDALWCHPRQKPSPIASRQ